jgi:hypothetical protein
MLYCSKRDFVAFFSQLCHLLLQLVFKLLHLLFASCKVLTLFYMLVNVTQNNVDDQYQLLHKSGVALQSL